MSTNESNPQFKTAVIDESQSLKPNNSKFCRGFFICFIKSLWTTCRLLRLRFITDFYRLCSVGSTKSTVMVGYKVTVKYFFKLIERNLIFIEQFNQFATSDKIEYICCKSTRVYKLLSKFLFECCRSSCISVYLSSNNIKTNSQGGGGS